MRARIKICGITRAEDLAAAVEAGADAIGLVFYEKSARAVTIEQAKSLIDQMPPFVSTVALFVNPSVEWVSAVLSTLAIDLLQFHGEEPAEFCQQFDRDYLKAISISPTDSPQSIVDRMSAHPQARGFLVDTFDRETVGGSGRQFDWSLLPNACSRPIILAGGLNPDNVCQAITQVSPYGVDVSSGVEAGVKGVKDSVKMQAFCRAVYSGAESSSIAG